MTDRYKHIREAQQSTASSETVNVVGMPEFDGLLDHIYEYGTASEGVIEKANAFAQAVIARYAPKKPTVHPAITHCDNCGCDWLDNGLNPIGCPYCKQHAAASIQAEIEALRAEVAEWKRVAAAQAELQNEAEERAELLAEALREARQMIRDLRMGLRYAVRVWALADEIEWSEAEIDEAVERIIGYAKKEARND